jgi:hypothetical protein
MMKSIDILDKLKAVFTFMLVSAVLIISANFQNCMAQGFQGKRVTIIESRDDFHSHIIDSVWHHVASAVGHSCTIVPRSFLDDTNNIETTDILIVSAGCVSITGNRIETIKKFLTHGRNVYLQTEYSTTMSSNYAFKYIVNQLGGSFSWTITVSGDLHPMYILGSLSFIPNYVPFINYFWYGCAGLGDSTIENYMEYQGNYFGFIFTPPNTSYGEMITSSDQDWVQSGTSKQLMQNILYRLANTITGKQNISGNLPDDFSLSQSYPNPFNPVTKIKFDIPLSRGVSAGRGMLVNLVIYDILGREISTLVNEELKPGTYETEWDGSSNPSGVYFYKLITTEYSETKKMILIK